MAKFSLQTDRRDNQLTIYGLHCGDNGIRTFDFLLLEGAKPLALPRECTATMFSKKADGTTLFESCEIDGSTVRYKLCGGSETASLTSVAGTVDCEIRVTAKDGEIITSPKFSFYVEKVLQDDGAIEAESSFTALTDALGRVLAAESGLKSKVFTVPYRAQSQITEDYSDEIRNLVYKIENEKDPYALFLKTATEAAPASITFASRFTEISATVHGDTNKKYVIRIDYQGNVSTDQGLLYVNDVTEMDTYAKAPSGAAVIEYVQDYVGNIGGAGGASKATTVFEMTTTEEIVKIDTGYTPTAADGIVMVHFMIPATGQSQTKNFWISLSSSPNSQNYISWLSMFGNNISGVTQIIVPVSKEKFISVIANSSTASASANFQRVGTEKPYNLTLKIGSADSTVPFPIGTKIAIVKYGGGLE